MTSLQTASLLPSLSLHGHIIVVIILLAPLPPFLRRCRLRLGKFAWEESKGASIYDVCREGGGVSRNAANLLTNIIDVADKEGAKNPKIRWTSNMEAP